jgi:hypothetical protein
LERELELNRRSDRITLSLSIQVVGADAQGRKFRDEARTRVVTRFGGRIVLARDLSPETEVTVVYPARGRQAQVRVVGRIGSFPEGHQYGIEVLDPQENLWGIHFPSAREAEEAVGRVLLECTACHAQEVACLDGLALELFQTNRSISRPCACTEATTVWGEVTIVGPEGAVAAQAARGTLGARSLAERHSQGWSIQACVLTEVSGEDLVWTRSPSKDGVRFLSELRYDEKQKVEIALPYQLAGGNIFIPAEIRWASGEPEGGVILYEATYLRRVRKATRYSANVKVYVGILGVGLRLTGRLVDLSMTGVLMRTSETLEAGTSVRLGVELGVDTFRTVAVVRRTVPGVGIAFEFAQMGQRDRQLLGRLLQTMKLSQGN